MEFCYRGKRVRGTEKDRPWILQNILKAYVQICSYKIDSWNGKNKTRFTYCYVCLHERKTVRSDLIKFAILWAPGHFFSFRL